MKTKAEKKTGTNRFLSPDELMTYKYCDKCKQVKPPRSHHCSICGSCIFRMDHHCPWVGTCVGLHNHKYFFNFLMYTAIGCLTVALCMFNNRVSDSETISQMMTRYSRDQAMVITMMVSATFCLATTGLMGLHFYLISTNKSSIEMETLSFENPFNMGFKQNWIQLFGDDPKTWFIPISPKIALNGLDYPTRRRPYNEI